MRTAVFIAAGVLILLAFLGIGQAYRSDEVWSLQTVTLPWTAMMDKLQSDIHPPLYYLLLRGWVGAFGDSEAASRSLSVILHLLAAGAVFLATRRRYGFTCAAVFLASPLGLVTAQLTRMYSLLELTAALSLWFWLRFPEEVRPRFHWLALFVLANVAGTFTHIWFFFFLAALAAAHLAIYRLRHLGWMAVAGVLSLIPYALLWLPVMLRQAGHTNENLAWLRPPDVTAPLEVLLMQGGTALILALFAWRKRTTNRAAAVLWLFAVLLPFGLSWIKPVFWARFTVVALPALAIALGTAISAALGPARATIAVAALAAVLTGGQILTQRPDCDSRWTAQWLSTHAKPDDIVVFTNLSRLPIDYYWNKLQPTSRRIGRSFPQSIDTHPGYEGIITPAIFSSEAQDLTRSLQGKRHLILLHGFSKTLHDQLVATLDAKFPREQAECVRCPAMLNYFNEITVYNLSPKQPAPQAQSDASGAASPDKPAFP